MIYKAYLKQIGEGCDYTIGCAQTIINIQAGDIDEAMRKLYHKVKENYTGELTLESCVLYEINDIVICNLEKWYEQIDAAEIEAEERRAEELERKEYERLKAKFKD